MSSEIEQADELTTPIPESSKREYLLAQIRQKDMIIESLLKQVCCKPVCFGPHDTDRPDFYDRQLHDPYRATPMSIASYRMATSPSNQNKKNVLDWLDRLQNSVRNAGGSAGPSGLGLSSRAEAESTEEEEKDSEGEEQDEQTEGGSTVGTVKVEKDDRPQSLPDSAVPLGLIAELALSNKPKGKKGKKPAKDDEENEADDNVVSAWFQCHSD